MAPDPGCLVWDFGRHRVGCYHRPRAMSRRWGCSATGAGVYLGRQPWSSAMLPAKDAVRTAACTVDEHGRWRLTLEGLYGRLKCPPSCPAQSIILLVPGRWAGR